MVIQQKEIYWTDVVYLGTQSQQRTLFSRSLPVLSSSEHLRDSLVFTQPLFVSFCHLFFVFSAPYLSIMIAFMKCEYSQVWGEAKICYCHHRFGSAFMCILMQRFYHIERLRTTWALFLHIILMLRCLLYISPGTILTAFCLTSLGSLFSLWLFTAFGLVQIPGLVGLLKENHMCKADVLCCMSQLPPRS